MPKKPSPKQNYRISFDPLTNSAQIIPGENVQSEEWFIGFDDGLNTFNIRPAEGGSEYLEQLRARIERQMPDLACIEIVQPSKNQESLARIAAEELHSPLGNLAKSLLSLPAFAEIEEGEGFIILEPAEGLEIQGKNLAELVRDFVKEICSRKPWERSDLK